MVARKLSCVLMISARAAAGHRANSKIGSEACRGRVPRRVAQRSSSSPQPSHSRLPLTAISSPVTLRPASDARK